MPDQHPTSQHKVEEVSQIVLVTMMKRDVQQLLTSRQHAQQRRTVGKVEVKAAAMKEIKKATEGSNVNK